MSPFYQAEVIPGTVPSIDEVVRATGRPREEIAKAMERVEREQQQSTIWKNDLYQVVMRPIPTSEHGFGEEALVVHLSIKRLDREPIRDWRDLMQIKRALGFGDCDALELFPADDRVVDTANQYHLWVMSNSAVRIPVGWFGAPMLADAADAGFAKAKQRAFSEIDELPDWLIWSNEHRAWWRSAENGYTPTVSEAGRYKFSEATRICRCAAIGSQGEIPNETMVPAKVADILRMNRISIRGSST